jgi:hypothetical protein
MDWGRLWPWKRKPVEQAKPSPLFMVTPGISGTTGSVTCSCCQKQVSIWRTYGDGVQVCVPCSGRF